MIGHSMGGLVVQQLLDGPGFGRRGHRAGAAARRIAGPRATWAGLPAILSGHWHKVRDMSLRRFAWSFCHTPGRRAARGLRAPGRRRRRAGSTGSSVRPRHRGRLSQREARAFAHHGASGDRAVDASTIRWNYAGTAVRRPSRSSEFPDRTHWLIADTGWRKSPTRSWAGSTEAIDAGRG